MPGIDAFSWEDWTGLGVALAVGLLLGLQRERTWAREKKTGPAGARTFPLVALSGAVAALASRAAPEGVPAAWLPAAGLLALGALVALAYFRSSAPERSIGITTEVLLLLTYLLGCTAVAGHAVAAGVVGIAALVLLGLKESLHGFAGRLTDADEAATLKFLAVALLIVPFLPDRAMGPYDAFNPHDVGLMVVLVAGVSFLGYVAVKVVGPDRGLLITGLLGGLASTTATTVAFARRSRETPALSVALASATMAACTVLFPRVLVLAAVANPRFVPALLPILAAMALVGATAAALGLLARRKSDGVDVPLKNPFQLAPAFWFALVYAGIVLVVKAAQAHFGESGLYAAGAISGATDVDAMTLSAARLERDGGSASTLARVVGVAVLSNTLVKAGIAFALGSRAYAWRVAAALLATAAAGGATLLLVR
jgi:uncharacterized membrane protein (DUF4010 family)